MARILTLTLNPALDLTVRLPTLAPGEVNRSEALLGQAAGKGVNVAQVLADLGHSLTVAGFLGADNAQPFEALFRRRGFIDAFVRVPGETRSNIKLAESSGRITDINGPGPQVSDSQQDALLDRLDLIAGDFELAVVAGSLPRGVDPQWLRDLLLRLQGHGLKVAFDCSGAALRAGIEAAPWLIKPNDQELGEACGQLAGSDAELAAQVESLRARGVGQVVLSQGAAGVRWFGPQGVWQAVPPQVEVASTVGAGDSLLAGMVHGLLAGWPAERILRQATAVAALAVTQLEFGIGDVQRLQRIEDAVQVQALAASQP
ncbi:1-phosphofructokinase [Pseudomonas nitritireducens]|uniref:Phosphofructokinase n=1 Tax=Pseudomonas nitroreducens TaxID=46680 RepID=A0A7W7P189_PSENT|nr:1-phosphofructokinase [Pseudomonas nitritireducens]MBB4863434.1 1-phosphofructokinase [Pseudomonas nitritireducens]